MSAASPLIRSVDRTRRRKPGRTPAALFVVALVAVSCVADGGDTLPVSSASGAPSTPLSVAAPATAPSAADGSKPLTRDDRDRSPVGTFRGVVTRLAAAPTGMVAVVADADDDEPTSLVVVDRDGRTVAERPVTAGTATRPPRVTLLDDAIAFIDGDTDRWQILDPAGLTVLGEIEVVPGPQTISDGEISSTLALGHWRLDADLDVGVRTAQAATLTDIAVLDPPADDGSRIATSTRRWELPSCGGRDVASVGDRSFVTVRCSWLLAELGPESTIAALWPMHRGEAWMEPHDGALYLSYRNLGVVSRVDPETGETRSFQVELTPGQLMGDVRFAADAAWVIVGNDAGTTPATLLRFSEDLTEVTVLDLGGWRPAIGWDDDVAWFAPDTGGLVPIAYGDITVAPVPTLPIDPPARLDAQEGRTAEIVALEERFASVFDPSTDPITLRDVLERADELEPARQEVAAFVTDDLFGAELVVLTFVPRGDEAIATFTFTVDGAPLLAPQVIRLERSANGWAVSAASFCDAIEVLFIDCPIPV